MKKILIALATVAALSGCIAAPGSESSPEAVAAAAFREEGPQTLTIITMINNRTGGGGHSALMVKSDQTVIFDPAGSFRDPRVVERGDVLYGMSPRWVSSYKSAHARTSFHVVSQEITVTPAQAAQALRLVESYGSVPAAFCANSTTDILSQIDGFQNIRRTFYPKNLMEQIAARGDVRTTRLYENDDGDVIDAVRAAQLISQ